MDKKLSEYFQKPEDNWYHLRFDKHLSEDDMKLLFTDLGSNKWIYSQEVGDPNEKWVTGKKHTHVVCLLSEKKTASQLNTILKKYVLNDDKTSRSTSKVRTTCRRMVMYILKEGDGYHSHGFSEDFIKICQDMAYKKYNPKKFTDSLEKIEVEFYEDTRSKRIALVFFACKYINLKLEYNQNPTRTNVENYLHRHTLKKYKGLRDEFASACASRTLERILDSN